MSDPTTMGSGPGDRGLADAEGVLAWARDAADEVTPARVLLTRTDPDEPVTMDGRARLVHYDVTDVGTFTLVLWGDRPDRAGGDYVVLRRDDAPHVRPALADRWELTGVPAEPPVGTAVRDRHGQVWVRGAHGRWARPGVLTLQGGTPWVEILLGYGPLVRLVPADDDARGAR